MRKKTNGKLLWNFRVRWSGPALPRLGEVTFTLSRIHPFYSLSRNSWSKSEKSTLSSPWNIAGILCSSCRFEFFKILAISFNGLIVRRGRLKNHIFQINNYLKRLWARVFFCRTTSSFWIPNGCGVTWSDGNWVPNNEDVSVVVQLVFTRWKISKREVRVRPIKLCKFCKLQTFVFRFVKSISLFKFELKKNETSYC